MVKEKLLSIQEAAKILKVSTKTLRRWEGRSVLVPQRTDGNHRRYSSSQIEQFSQEQKNKKRQKIEALLGAAEETAPFINVQGELEQRFDHYGISSRRKILFI